MSERFSIQSGSDIKSDPQFFGCVAGSCRYQYSSTGNLSYSKWTINVIFQPGKFYKICKGSIELEIDLGANL